MMSEQHITDTLTRIGFTESQIPAVMRDVGEIIFGNIFVAYLPSLPEPERMKIVSFGPQELQQYFKDHAESLPRLSQAQFNEIHDTTWEDYFASMR
jgi:hypothetical protein